MRLNLFGLSVEVNGVWVSVSCDRFEVVFRWRALLSSRVVAETETGYANGRKWKTADFAIGPVWVTRFA